MGKEGKKGVKKGSEAMGQKINLNLEVGYGKH